MIWSREKVEMQRAKLRVDSLEGRYVRGRNIGWSLMHMRRRRLSMMHNVLIVHAFMLYFQSFVPNLETIHLFNC